MTWLLVACAGGLGSACRYVLDSLLTAWTHSDLPWGTLLVNLSGSLAVGVVAGSAATHVLSSEVAFVVAGGFLGAYTTFSTAVYEVVRLWEEGARRAAVIDALAPLVLASAAALTGWLLVT